MHSATAIVPPFRSRGRGRTALLAAFALAYAFLAAPAQAGPRYALSFDGIDDWVDMQAGVIPSSGDFTVECWMRCFSATPTSEILSQGGPDYAFYIGVESGVFRLGDGWVMTGIPCPTGSWHHVALTRWTGACTVFYIDGMRAEMIPAAIPSPAPLTGLRLGRQHGGEGEYWHGQIDEVRVWNVGRSDADISNNMARALTGAEPGLVAYWRFNEGAGATAGDATSNRYSGILTNGTAWVAPGAPVFAAETAAATNIGSDHACLNGVVYETGPQTWAWFEWGTNTAYGNRTAVTNLGSGTGFKPVSVCATGLAAGLTCHFRIVASNSLGWVATGLDASFDLHQFGEIQLDSGAIYASGGWGDLDNDQRLDLLLGGWPSVNAVAAGGYNGRLYFNVGDLGFRESSTSFLNYGPVAWGEANNDGRLDVLYSGVSVAPSFELAWLAGTDCIVYTNSYPYDVSPFTCHLRGVVLGDAQWVDFNNDGRQDIALAGVMEAVTGSGSLEALWGADIYRNNGGGEFVPQPNHGICATAQSVMAWADHDCDGWMDVLVNSATNGFSGARTILYHNNRNGTFSGVDCGLPDMNIIGDSFNAQCAFWGDYDNDGWLDVLLTGLGADRTNITRIYRNNHDGSFSWNTNAALAAVMAGTAAWGDYDNDGWADIALAGMDVLTTNPVSRIYHNNHDGTFAEFPAGLIGSFGGLLAWGDCDGDGRLDLALCGAGLSPTGGPYAAIGRVYHNSRVPTNTPPSPPGNLASVVAGAGVTLTWNAASDAQTPSAGLSYNLRVGTTPGGEDVVSPAADLQTGWRRLAEPGRWHGLTACLTNLPPGTYYWSVQAIDSAFAGSRFAPERSFYQTGRADASFAGPQSVLSTSLVLLASMNPNGLPTSGYIEWGTNSLYGNQTAPVLVGPGTNSLLFRQYIAGLQPGVYYHYRLVTQNAAGTSYGPDFVFYTDPGALSGDANGDGAVDRAELDAVLAGYWPTSPWLMITNALGLGYTNVSFGLTDRTAGAYTVEVSTNNSDWRSLGPASPRYEFTDTNAPVAPVRFYRLRWP